MTVSSSDLRSRSNYAPGKYCEFDAWYGSLHAVVPTKEMRRRSGPWVELALLVLAIGYAFSILFTGFHSLPLK